MEVAQGHVTDRPFARTVYTVAVRHFTGDLILAEDGRRYKVSWEDGRAVAAESPSPGDSAGRVALAAGLVTSTHVAASLEALARAPGRDPVEILAELARLSPEQVVRLRRRLFAHRAARIFALPKAQFVLDNARSMSAAPDVPSLDARWLIYFGVRTHYDVQRLDAELAALKDRSFVLARDSQPSLSTFGFGPSEQAIVERVRQRPWTIDQLLGTSSHDPHMVLCVIYSLLATDCLEPTANVEPGVEPAQPASSRRSKPTTMPPMGRTAQGTMRRIFYPKADTNPPTKPVLSMPRTAPTQPPPISNATLPGAATRPRDRQTSSPPITDPSAPRAVVTRPSTTPTVPPPITDPLPPRERPQPQPEPPSVRARGSDSPSPAPQIADPPKARADAAFETRQLIADKVTLLEHGADHFRLLGLSQSSSPDELRATYFALAKQLHPDRLRALGIADEDGAAHRVFAQINLAFQVLSSSDKRFDYVRVLSQGGEAAIKKAQAAAEDLASRIFQAEDAFRHGEMALRRQQFGQARELFEKAAQLNPEEAEHRAYAAWATWLAAPDKVAVAAAVQKRLAEAISLAPRAVSAHFFRGQVAKQSGRNDAALEAFKRVLKLAPDHADAALEVRLLESRIRREDTKGSTRRIKKL